jgi:hypothetical protein
VLQNIFISYPGKASRGLAYMPLWRLDQVPERIKEYPEHTMFGELPSWGFYIRHVQNIEMNEVRLFLSEADFRPVLVFDDVENVSIKNMQLPQDKKEQIILKNVLHKHLDDTVIHYLLEL